MAIDYLHQSHEYEAEEKKNVRNVTEYSPGDEHPRRSPEVGPELEDRLYHHPIEEPTHYPEHETGDDEEHAGDGTYDGSHKGRYSLSDTGADVLEAGYATAGRFGLYIWICLDFCFSHCAITVSLLINHRASRKEELVTGIVGVRYFAECIFGDTRSAFRNSLAARKARHSTCPDSLSSFCRELCR